MTYYQYFRLKGPPFQAASPDGPVYFSPTHLAGLATLESGLSGELTGLTMLTGEVGTGKTTLIYSLLQRDYKRVRIAHIEDPKLSFLEIMRLILTQLNLYSTGSTKLDYLEALDRFLNLRGKHERIAIVVDESQALSDDVLEELRLLSGHGQRDDRSLQLILVGQPELAERLKKPELRQLNQRISSRGVLKPLNHAQSANYVECRLSAQGGKSSAIFAPGALKRLLRYADGIPRKINVLCHTAMQAAYDADEKRVSVKTAKKVAAEYHDSVSIAGQKPAMRLVLGLLGGAALVSLVLLVLGYRHSDRVQDAASSARVAEKTVASAKQVKAVDQRGVARLPNSDGTGKAPGSAVAHAAELQASLAPKAAASPSPALDAPKPATTAHEVASAASAPVPAMASAASRKKTAVLAPALGQRKQVIVRYGDTLEDIAVRYLGSKSKINELIDANPQLTNINQLNVGEVIYLPPDASSNASQDQTATAHQVPNVRDSADR